jgi:chromosome segregation ATPase
VKVEAREREVIELRESLEHLQKVAEANRTTAENELKGRRQAEAKLYEVSGQLSELTVKLHERETAAGDASKQKQRFENEAKKRGDRLASTEESNRTLRERVLELGDDLRVVSTLSRSQKQETLMLQRKVTELETQCHDHTTLYQFIHKITERTVSSVDSAEE